MLCAVGRGAAWCFRRAAARLLFVLRLEAEVLALRAVTFFEVRREAAFAFGMDDFALEDVFSLTFAVFAVLE